MAHGDNPRSAISRRALLAQGAGALALFVSRTNLFAQTKVPITIYKDPNCGCCHQWVQHMAANGFATSVKDTREMAPIKRQNKVPAKLESCHTAIVGSYVIEGHVPAADVKRLLAEKPKGTIGLTIPGMPASAPGMDIKPFQPYTVLAFDAKGATTVFAKHDKS
jgi:hypothetical protein